MSTAQSYRKNKVQGFTLIELLVVVLILGALAAIVIPRFMNVEEMAEKNAVGVNVGQVNEVINAHYQLTDTIPDGLDSILNGGSVPASLEDWVGPTTVSTASAAIKALGLTKLYDTSETTNPPYATLSDTTKVGKIIDGTELFIGGTWHEVVTDDKFLVFGIGKHLIPNTTANVTVSFDRIPTDPGLLPGSYKNFLLVIKVIDTAAEYVGCIDPQFTGG